MEFKRIGEPLLPPCKPSTPRAKPRPTVIESLSSEINCKQHSPKVQRAQAIAMRTLKPMEANQSALRWSCQCQNGFCYCPMLK